MLQQMKYRILSGLNTKRLVFNRLTSSFVHVEKLFFDGLVWRQLAVMSL